MQPLYPNTHRTSERRIPKAKQGDEKVKNIVKTKKKVLGLLCSIHPLIWQWMLNDFPKDGEQNVKVQKGSSIKDIKNSMDGASKQLGIPKENGNRKNTFT